MAQVHIFMLSYTLLMFLLWVKVDDSGPSRPDVSGERQETVHVWRGPPPSQGEHDGPVLCLGKRNGRINNENNKKRKFHKPWFWFFFL